MTGSHRRFLLPAAAAILVAAVALVVVRIVTTRPGWSGEEPQRLFAAGSFWNRRLPRRTALAADSAALVRNFNEQIHNAYGTVDINTTSYSAPVYVVNRYVRSVRVGVVGCGNLPADTAAAGDLRRVPIPAGALPAAGTDHDLVILQPSTGREWELWEAHHSATGWTACNGGELHDVTRSDGVFPAPTGVSASGMSILAGMIRLSDLRAGRIDHALNVAVPWTARYPSRVAPADRTDGWSTALDAIPEGTRYRLAPWVDVAALHLTRLGEMVARALQQYGMVVSDTAGAVSFQGQDPVPLTASGRRNPWTAWFGSTPSYQALSGVPWRDLQALAPQSPG